MSTKPKQLTVTAIQDSNTGVFTAFFNEMPGLLVQTKSQDDIVQKLKIVLDAHLTRLNSIKNNIQVQQKSIF
ncbi:hypothetical protein [Sediminibacterium sp.]|uniref:hypothetical protein n=1 Tax=Sediminibacterium sp. TaxID=1917865 RepID=UPI0025DE7156|nr:hypothetical protein [Sediminibacterium sp.]